MRELTTIFLDIEFLSRLCDGPCQGASRDSIIRAEGDDVQPSGPDRDPIKRMKGFQGEMPIRNRRDSRRA